GHSLGEPALRKLRRRSSHLACVFLLPSRRRNVLRHLGRQHPVPEGCHLSSPWKIGSVLTMRPCHLDNRRRTSRNEPPRRTRGRNCAEVSLGWPWPCCSARPPSREQPSRVTASSISPTRAINRATWSASGSRWARASSWAAPR